MRREKVSRKNTTSSQVAELAGVSQATVSMVLNHKYNVSFSRKPLCVWNRRQRNWAMSCRAGENNRKTKREKLIVVFCPTLTSPYYVLLLQGIEAVADERGCGVFICNTQRDAGLEEKYLRMMEHMQPQGIIYASNPILIFLREWKSLPGKFSL